MKFLVLSADYQRIYAEGLGTGAWVYGERGLAMGVSSQKRYRAMDLQKEGATLAL